MQSNYAYLTSLEDYSWYIEALSSYSELALDIETYIKREYFNKGIGSALDHNTAGISLLTICPKNETPVIFDILLLERAGYDPKPLCKLLLSRKYLLGVNLKFDFRMIRQHFGIKLWNAMDVMVLSQLVANATGSKFGQLAGGHSLRALCLNYLNIHISGKGKEQTDDWYPRPINEAGDRAWRQKLEYAASDVQYLFKLRDILMPTICNPLPKTVLIPHGSETPPYGLGMGDLIPVEMDMVTVVAEMEFNGLPIHREILGQIQDAIKCEDTGEGRYYEVASELCKEFSLPTYPSPWTSFDMPTDQSLKILNSPVKLKELVNKKVGIELDNVQGAVIERLVDLLATIHTNDEKMDKMQAESSQRQPMDFVDEDEEALFQNLQLIEEGDVVKSLRLAKLIVEYKKLAKQDSMDLRRYINPVSGRIHGSYRSIGTATGRLCIAAGQRVLIVDQTKPIEEVQVGDLVYCYSNDGAITVRKVLNVYCKGIAEVIAVHWRLKEVTGRLLCTRKSLD